MTSVYVVVVVCTRYGAMKVHVRSVLVGGECDDDSSDITRHVILHTSFQNRFSTVHAGCRHLSVMLVFLSFFVCFWRFSSAEL